MPTPKTISKHGGVAKVRLVRQKNGTLVRVYFYADKKMKAEALKGMKNGKAQ